MKSIKRVQGLGQCTKCNKIYNRVGRYSRLCEICKKKNKE